jgi:hypothetical protein
MNISIARLTFSVTLLVLAGCSSKEGDCKNPASKEQQQECAHSQSTEDRISPTPNPKKW